MAEAMDLCGISPGTVSPLIPFEVLWTRGFLSGDMRGLLVAPANCR